MSPHLIVIDIGNTSTTVAETRGHRSLEISRFPRAQGAGVNIEAALQHYPVDQVDGVALASVVPELTGRWADAFSGAVGKPTWVLTVEEQLEIGINYPNPETIGPDRLANAIAGIYEVGSPVVIADFGTALTFDVVLPDVGYTGGVIAPGIGMMYTYLSEKTALLPELEPTAVESVIGKSTEEAMHAGALYGYRGMVREIWHEIQKETGHESLPLLATGGFAGTVLKDFGEPVDIIPDLTLRGLSRGWEFARA